MNIEDIKSLMDNFDPASLLPELDTLLGKTEFLMRILLLICPVVLLVLGIFYALLPPREANYYLGYRCFFGMGSQEAWRFTQRIAGIVWTALGLGMGIVMFLIGGSFRDMELMDMVWKAVRCGVWEVGLILAACIGINVTVAVFFDAKGGRRRTKS